MIKEELYNYNQKECVQQEIIQKNIVTPKPLEFSEYITLLSKPAVPSKPKSRYHNERTEACNFNDQKQNSIVEQESNKTFAEKKEFFEKFSGNYKPKGKVNMLIEKFNNINSHIELMCKPTSIIGVCAQTR